MYISGQQLEVDARKAAEEKAKGLTRVGLSPAELKRRMALKKAKQRAALEAEKKAG